MYSMCLGLWDQAGDCVKSIRSKAVQELVEGSGVVSILLGFHITTRCSCVTV